MPNGVAGEICLGGAGLARGYVKRPELSSERFIPNPFVEAGGARLYCSGDLARRLDNGDLQYLGRIDQQVKIRGFRVELGEIESVLSAHQAVREAAVVLSSTGRGEPRLVAYVARAAGAPVDTSELLAHMRSRIPDYSRSLPNRLSMPPDSS